MSGALVPGLLGFEPLRAELAALALAAPLVAVLGAWSLAARRRARERLVAARHQALFLPRFSAGRARLRLACAALACLFLALAALGPVRGYTLREISRRGLDLVVCVDTSRSMLVQDVKPDRLTRAKREITGLLQRLSGDRAALLAFAGDVRAVAPLTHDRATLGLFVETLNTEENLRGGTDIGGVLEQALALFDGRTGAHEAIVLVTDGEDLEGRGLEVAQRAAERGIRIFVVGMATAGGGKIPSERGFVRDEQGAEVVSRLDGASLERIAEVSGGAYLSAERAVLPLEELFQKRIARLEGRELFAGKERIPHDRFQWPLVLAATCMLVEAGLRERRGPSRAQRRAERAARNAPAGPAPGQRAAALWPPLLLALAPQALPDASAQQPPPAPATAEPAPGVVPERWSDGLAAGLAEVERRSQAGETERALALLAGLAAPTRFATWRAGLEQGALRAAVDVGQPLYDALGLSGIDARERAAIELARGLVRTHASAREGEPPERRAEHVGAAEAAFQAARGGAGPGALRRDAIYALGTLDLLEGERQRALLPEISGEQAAPGAPIPGVPGVPGAPGAPGGAASEDAPDPLALARAAYLAAREHLVERLREDWRDADTQADVELIQRRLRELAEIEREREQQKKEQQQQQQQQDQDQQQQDQQEQQDQEQQDQQPQDPQDQEQQDQQEPQDGEQQPPEEPPQGDDAKPEEGPEDAQPEEAEGEPEERLLTREEVQRLLDRLLEIEEQGERVRAELYRTRRAKVDKDW